MNTGEHSDGNLREVIEILKHEEHLRQEEQYRKWCDYFATLPQDFKRQLKDDLIVGVEIQPHRWIQHGLDLIDSRRGMGSIQLSGGITGADARAYLPYPVFQMGAEIFLKGMWLYQFEECRKVRDETYIALERRKHYLSNLIQLSRLHDLSEIIRHVEIIPEYKKDQSVSRFLKIVEGISKQFYHPLAADKKSWADERYPKRFYNDSTKISAADAHKSYPDHWLVSRLFSEAAESIERIWKVNAD